MVENQLYLKKQWFIKTKDGKVEENYEFDIKKVHHLFLSCVNLLNNSYWAQELTEMS